MPIPTKEMAEEAQRGLDWREEYGRGGTQVGVARARDIVNQRNLSMRTLRRMRSYFARHEVDKEGEGFYPDQDGFPSAGRIAWALWAGDSGKAWVERQLEDEDREQRPYEGEHAARIREPEGYDYYRRVEDEGGLGVDFVYGIQDGNAEIQSIRFDIDYFTEKAAVEWLERNNFEPIKFEPAVPVDDDRNFVILSQQMEADDMDYRAEPDASINDDFKDDDEKRHIKRIEENDTEVIVVFGKSEEYKEETDVELEREFRPAQKLEVREAHSGDVRVSGYAAVFDQETNIGGMFTEQINRGAFKDAIGRDDVVFLINHEGLPLARTRSGTLRLEEDEHGLYMEASLDASDPDVRSIVPKMKRGDLDKMSFAFVPTRQSWDDSKKIPKRMIEEAQLYDVSIVTTPAYDGTEIGLRSLEKHRSKLKNKQTSRRLRMKAKFQK